MGYTNFFNFKTSIDKFSDGYLKDIEIVLNKYKNELHYKDGKYYYIKNDLVFFNGKRNDVESFFLTPRTTEIDFSKKNLRERIAKDGCGFCTTRGGTYDELVCSILLITIKHYPNNIIIDSDGFTWVIINKQLQLSLEGRWDEAIKYIKKQFNYNYACFVGIQKHLFNNCIFAVQPDGTREELSNEENHLYIVPVEYADRADTICNQIISNVVYL